jgi:hypothetical protein
VGRTRAGIKIEVLVADEGKAVDADQVADALVEHLKTDAVTRWAEEIEAALAAARALSLPAKQEPHDPKQAEKDLLKARIAELTRELEELENSIGPV